MSYYSKRSSRQHQSMESLPNELYVRIRNLLNMKEKQALRRVSPRWKVVIDESLKFNPVLSNRTWKYVNNLDVLTVNSLKIKNLTLPSLNVNAAQIVFLTPDQECSQTNSSSIIQTLLLNGETLKSLIFESGSLKGIRKFNESLFNHVRLQNLVSLKVEFGNCGEIDKITNLCKMKLPSLSELEINAVRPYENLDKYDDMKTYLGFYQFICGLSSCYLKKVKIGHFQMSAISRDFDFNTALHDYQLEYNDVLKSFEGICLEVLSIKFSEWESLNDDNESGFSLGTHLMTSQRCLTVLDISLLNHSMENVNDPINMTILHNSSTLKRIKIFFGSTIQEIRRFFCPSIQLCDNLEDLELLHFIFRAGNLTFPSKRLKKLSLSGLASRLSEFEILNWIASNLLGLEELNIDLNWNRNTMTRLEWLTLRQVIAMPKLKVLRFLEPNSPIFTKFFESHKNVCAVKHYQKMAQYDSSYSFPRTLATIEVEINVK